MDNQRYKTTRNVSIVNALTNTLLAIFKVVIGSIGNSHALVADGIHSFSDVISDALVLVAAKIGGRHPDKRHPYGHQRIETIGAIIIAIILLFVGAGIIFDTIQHIISHETKPLKGIMVLIVAIVSIFTNEWLYHYTKKAGKKVNSNLLLTNAWHNRSDALVSVIVLISVIGTLLGIHYLDAAGALIIAILILKIAIKMVWTSLSELIDAGVDDDTLKKIRHVISGVAGVVSIHQLRTRLHGGNIFVDVHIMVEPKISVSEGHYISDQVLAHLMNDMQNISDITVHIDPEDDEKCLPNLRLPNREALQQKLKEVWHDLPHYEQIQKLLLHYLDGQIHVEVYFPHEAFKNQDQDAILQKYQAACKSLNEIKQVDLFFTAFSPE
ncbi:MAG: cation diffusion facilitator family transporter [Gammaproteobacteria bacterium]|nr:cation diffusion facilitator family transporter [Gammaproteobacteria bacterium]MCH9744890.1 cation diffusion facilitator family transporter [Gammaproteobacteria bacterium]